ncbi:MAG: hypothetical protein ER33_07095 [Cyanobium sp. CACIAM 14]|nr:MAG: hypothetical protein ER33_07095 [Cyanobium sp. CACIAM 14]
MDLRQHRQLARRIFAGAVAAAQPERLLREAVVVEGSLLRIRDDRLPLPRDRKIHVFGSGKAALGMARGLLDRLGERAGGGLIVVPQGAARATLGPLTVIEGGHPLPDDRSVQAAERMLAALAALHHEDVFLYLLSGGSSALLEKPLPPLRLADLRQLTELMLRSHVPIEQINAVRKPLSLVKGGRLGQCTRASGVVLLLSDVIGDDPGVIGSGPFQGDGSSFAGCRAILQRAGLWQAVPPAVREVVARGESGAIPELPERPRPGIRHVILGSNRMALAGARVVATQAGLPSAILTASLEGEAREVAKVLVAIAESVRDHHEPFAPPICLLCGGETTVTVKGGGRGGRNQELALAALQRIGDREGILLLSAGTDGIDGVTTAAGAIADGGYWREGRRLGLSIDASLQGNDSHRYFRRVGGLVETGPTGTNVMDLVLLIVSPTTQA